MMETELVKRLTLDKELDKDKELKRLYMSYANLYDMNLVDNLKLTSVELDVKYSTNNPSSWHNFLKYPIVKKYIEGYLDEIIQKRAMSVLSEDAGKARDAHMIAKDIDAKNKGSDNSNIVVMFMPQRKYVDKAS